VLLGRRVESDESFAIHFKIECRVLRRQHLLKWGTVWCFLKFVFYPEMVAFKEEWMCIKFCFSLGRTASETCGMLKLAIGKEMLSRPKRFDLFFKLRSWIEVSCDVMFCILVEKGIRKIGVEGIRMYGVGALYHFGFPHVKLLLLETAHSQLNIMYQDAAVPTSLPFLSRIR